MKLIKNLKRISCLLVLLSFAALFLFACGKANGTTVKTEKQSAATKSTVAKVPKEVKVTKLNDGGLKQELNTKATVSTTNKKELTFEVPVSQLQGLQVGDAMVINSGKQSFTGKILNIPTAPQPKQGLPSTGSKVIVTASVGPGVNLPPNSNGYSVTYLYNNRDPRTHYIKKDYVYYDGPRAYVYVTGPDRVVRRRYIRTGLINRYYAEILDEIEENERIVENYINYYVNNVVVPSIVEDYTNQIIDNYNDYIESLNKRWDFDEDVNTITIDVNDVDWNQLLDQDVILTDDDIIEISEEIVTETHETIDDYQDGEIINEERSAQDGVNDNNDNNDNNSNDNNDNNDGEVTGSGSFGDRANDNDDNKDDDEAEVNGSSNDDHEKIKEQANERENVEEATTHDNEEDDVKENAITSEDKDMDDNNSNHEDSNDNSGNDNNDNDNSNNDSDDNRGNDDSDNEVNETTTIEDDDAVSNE